MSRGCSSLGALLIAALAAAGVAFAAAQLADRSERSGTPANAILCWGATAAVVAAGERVLLGEPAFGRLAPALLAGAVLAGAAAACAAFALARRRGSSRPRASFARVLAGLAAVSAAAAYAPTASFHFPFVDLLSSIATAIVLGYGGYLVFDGNMTIGVLTAFLGYLTNFFDPVQQLSQLYSTFISAVAALDKIMDVLVEEPEVADADAAVELGSIQGHVRLDGVHFSYGTGGEVLHGIDLDVPVGTTVALVGHTGAGKSTIAKLIARFYDPTAGTITIDGIDLRSVRQETLRRQLGIVPQEGFLFAGTIAENIAFGRPGASHSEVAAAAAAVGADEFIVRLENGYDTELGERGFRLSLGQRQLVAFARALLADPRILILDEATSSVDIGTERKIERALRRLLQGRTAFVIAHRLSTIRDADMIVVLEHGLVVEQGTHDELLARHGLYSGLYGNWAADVA